MVTVMDSVDRSNCGTTRRQSQAGGDGRSGQLAHTFFDDVLDAGLAVPSSAAGVYGWSECFENIVQALIRLLTVSGNEKAVARLQFPPVLPCDVLHRTGFDQVFPHLPGSIHTFAGDDLEHARLLRGDPSLNWTTAVTPSDLVLCAAACHPIYPMCSGVLTPPGRHYATLGHCFRHERAPDLGRLRAFRMYEYVYLGDAESAVRHRDGWVQRGLQLFGDLQLPVEAAIATDPFFGRAGRVLAGTQRDQALKIELSVEIADPERPTAVMSANCHRDHFGVAFGITLPEGTFVHSACVGFGVERMALVLLRHHGLDPARWPRAVRDRLWP